VIDIDSIGVKNEIDWLLANETVTVL